MNIINRALLECCIATRSLYTRIPIQIQSRDSNTQAGSVVQVRTHLLTSDFISSTRGERHHFVSYYANNTPTLGTSRGPMSISQHHGRTPTSQHHCRTPTSQQHGRTPTSQHHGRNSTSAVCLSDRIPNCLPTWSKVNCQLILFQNLQILWAIAFGHDVIHSLAPFPISSLLWQLWLSYPLRTSVNCTQCYAFELRAE